MFDLQTQRKPDFSRAYAVANEILITSTSISSFPFSPKELVKEQSATVCRSYKKAQKYGVDIRNFGSESATLFHFHGKAIIFYDETKPQAHINYSILHELGNDKMGHPLSSIDDLTYRCYEIETNYFAAQLLMPEQLLRELQRRGVRLTIPFLQSAFGVSAQAAQKRINTLNKLNTSWRSQEEQLFDDIILAKFADFLDEIAPRREFDDFEEEYERQREREEWW